MEQLLNIAGSGSNGSGKGSKPDLASLLGPEFAGTDAASLKQQADQLWKFLDELSESDPSAYATFLQKQAKAAAQSTGGEGSGDGSSGNAASGRHGNVNERELVQGTAPVLIVEAIVVGDQKQQAEASGKASSSSVSLAELGSIAGSKAGGGGSSDGSTAAAVALMHIWAASKAAKLAPATTGASPARAVSSETTSWEGTSIPVAQLRQPRVLQATVPGRPTLHVHHLVAHEDVVLLAAKNVPPVLRVLLAEAVCQAVEAKHGLKLRREGRVLRVHSEHMPEAERAALSTSRSQTGAQRAAEGTHAQGLPTTILSQLASMSVGGAGSKGAPGSAAAAAPVGAGINLRSAGGAGGGGSSSSGSSKGAAACTAPPRGPLIQELGEAGSSAGSARDQPQQDAQMPQAAADVSGSSSNNSQQGAPAGSSVQQPRIQITLDADGRSVVVEAVLPEASSAADVDLEVTGRTLSLALPASGWAESAQLPADVDEGAARAKFDKQRKRLRVVLPVVG